MSCPWPPGTSEQQKVNEIYIPANLHVVNQAKGYAMLERLEDMASDVDLLAFLHHQV